MIPIISKEKETIHQTWFPKYVAVVNYEDGYMVFKNFNVNYVYCLNENNNRFTLAKNLTECKEFYEQEQNGFSNT